MTYLIYEAPEKRLQILECSISGTPAIGGYYTFSSNVLDNFDSGSVPTGFGTDTLTLASGHYLMRAFFSITRTQTDYNCAYEFEINGSAAGKFGSTGMYINRRNDVADVVVTDLTSTISVKLKCLNIENTHPTLASDSRVYIWRVDPS
jgi:hypothetical protein